MHELSRRSFAGACAATALGGAARAETAASAAPEIIGLVDPELRPGALEVLRFSATMPAMSEASLPQMRQGFPGMDRPPLPDVPQAAQEIAGGPDGNQVTIYVVNAKPGGARPGILHTHGGGFVVGSARSGIRDLQELAVALDCAIVTVEYRLAPETRFSGSIEDNYAALKWMHQHAGELGVDPRRIAVMGESAGGGHAALLAITARDRGELPVAFQCLIYPMLDDRTASSRQLPAHLGALVWTPASNRFGWRSFLGRAPGGARAPAGAVPARVTDLRGLPPAWIGVGALDLFIDEDIEYARRLIAARVPAELVVVPGAYHGFDGIARDTAVAQRFTATKIAALRRAFQSA